MVGVILRTDLNATIANKALARLSAADFDVLAYEVGSLIEDQTKRRILDEKTDPDGNAWAPWSARYAKSLTRRNRISPRSLLVGEGNPGLLESIQNYTAGEVAEVGTNLIYGATHQFGDETRGIPARPYLGVSEANRAEIEDLVADRMEALLQ